MEFYNGFIASHFGPPSNITLTFSNPYINLNDPKLCLSNILLTSMIPFVLHAINYDLSESPMTSSVPILTYMIPTDLIVPIDPKL